jgi:RNA polymerase sigma-70 factor (ECF subfamily)
MPHPTSTSAAGEAALLEAAQRGDREAFTIIVRRFEGVVYGYLRARLLEPADAEDLCQEVFLRCYARREPFEGAVAVLPWLIGIARNVLREHVRRIKRRKEVAWTELCLELDDFMSPRESAADKAAERLPGCLGSLGKSARDALEMRYHGQLRLADIGKQLCRSEGAVKLLMFRARQALRHCLERHAQGSDHE